VENYRVTCDHPATAKACGLKLDRLIQCKSDSNQGLTGGCDQRM
jgi:hypothetical protein